MKTWVVILETSRCDETIVKYFEDKQQALEFARDKVNLYLSVFVANIQYMTVTYNCFDKAITPVEG